jgi:hypothetical protein
MEQLKDQNEAGRAISKLGSNMKKNKMLRCQEPGFLA